MSKTAQYALCGTVAVASLGLLSYFILRGWYQDAFSLAAALATGLAMALAERRNVKCRLLGKRPVEPQEQQR